MTSETTLLMISTFGMLASAVYWLCACGSQADALVPVRLRRSRQKP
jgi:hypothetical protein